MAAGKGIRLSWSDHSDVDDNDNGDSGIDFGPLLEKLSLGPKKKLLVISLHGLLLHRAHIADKTKIPKSRRPDGRYGNNLIYKRPFVDQFMKFCLERFEVGIWSSAMEHNVDGVLDCAMGGMRKKLLFTWDQGQCTDTGFKCLENKLKPLFLKELSKVWDHVRHFSASDTLFIDDDPYRALTNPPHTSIFPVTYNARDFEDDALDPKVELGLYLDGVADADDVQAYVKEHPFGQPPITPNHPDWVFYSKVLRFLGKEVESEGETD